MAHSDAYHDTVSKMARKYSQYRLPHPSELQDSGDDEVVDSHNYKNSNSNSNSGGGGIINIHDASFINKQRSIPIAEDQEDDYDIDEEDEDILSEAQTMISHKSASIGVTLHNIGRQLSITDSKASSILSNGNNNHNRKKIVQFGPTSTAHYNPMEEIREIQLDRALFMDIFDKYFDEEKQGDVDLSEFQKGLTKLGAAQSEEQINKLFNVLLVNGDNENDGYLDREQFGDFLTRRFEAPQLVAFQKLLLSVIQEKTKKNSSRHGLLQADDAEQWDAAEVSLAELEMRQAMEQMVDNEMVKIKVKQVLYIRIIAN